MMLNKDLFQRDPTTSKLLNDGVAAVKDAVTDQERETLRYAVVALRLRGAIQGRYCSDSGILRRQH